MRHPAFLYASFAAAPFGGNVAGVVFLDEVADERWMQGVAADLAAPTTGFVDLPSAGEGDARVRFFTPRMEIGACGHVTVAVATALVEAGVWELGSSRARSVSASGGRVPLLLEASTEDSAVSVTMQQRLTHYEVRADAEVESILGDAQLDPALPIVVAGTGLRHLLVAISSASDLTALTVERDPITRLSSEYDVDTIGVYARAEDAVRMRDLCAGIGAVEEPASGTTSGALVLGLQRLGAVSASATIGVTMGVEMGRPSRLSVRLESDRQSLTANVSGGARRLLSGMLEV